MTYKQIEASRELRLWIGQVLVPAVGFGAVLWSKPEIRNAVTSKYEDIKSKLSKKQTEVK